MKLEVHLYFHNDSTLEKKLDQALVMIHSILRKENEIMSQLDDVLTAAEAAASANSSAEDSVMALLTTLSAQIAELKNNQTDPATVTRIQALSDALSAKAAALSAAVVANTPSA